MCGLIGGTGKVEARYLVALGCLAEDRGSDSAGVAWQVGDNLRIAKVAKNPLVAYPVDLAPALRHAAKYSGAVIGHTRQATQGAVTARNAHPFLDKEARIAWAHNGIIINDDEFGKFEVDSECLIGGIKKRDFSPYHGPIALLWIEDGKLHAFRKTNPLHRGIKRGAVYLASEADMLKAIGCHKIKELSEGFVYAWNGNTLESTTKVPYYTYAPSNTTLTYGDNWEGGCGYAGDGHYFRGEKEWHNHSIYFPEGKTFRIGCKGCEKEAASAKEKTEETKLIPVRRGGMLAESYIEKLEREEALKQEGGIVDIEGLCVQCQAEPHNDGSAYGPECIESWRSM